MLKFALTVFLFFAVMLVGQSAFAQRLTFEKALGYFSDPNFPESFYDSLDAHGFYRIDKTYPENCERVMYVYEKAGKSFTFANLQYCRQPFLNPYFNLKAKQQLEFQFQRNARPDFEKMRNAVLKQCVLLKNTQPVTTAKLGKSKKNTNKPARAYLHQPTGYKIIVCDFFPVSYIYLLK